MGSMLHHRFPNSFTDLFMDETDREVSTLTDRAFRSLCIGDDAVYNDDFLYGYSPFSCHKPLAGEPLKKNHHKESKKSGQHKHDKSDAQKDISHMSSLLKALSVAEESCEGMLIKNGGVTDSNGESWDKSALRSIQRELSEFSTDYHTGLTNRHYKDHLRHQSGDGLSNKMGKDVGLPYGKSTKVKNGKSTVKLRKLNVKNFFLHSEFSPFQTWRDFNRYTFGQEDTVSTILSTDNAPKWYDMPFYKELTEAHRKQTLHTEEAQTCHKEAVEPTSPTALKPMPPPPPPKVLQKHAATPAEKRCSSDGGDGTAAPWRRNRSRAKSAIPASQAGIAPQESNSKAAVESLLLVKKEFKSVEVKAVEEANSLASTPFSICQLMTPLIPSRQPTETSEILQNVLSPSALDLPVRPNSEAKVTPELPVKRETYKSLAFSILFNLKDNRKRVKSRYSPPKFKTLELPEDDAQAPQSDNVKQAGSEGNASGLSTPAILKDGLTVCSPISETLSPSNVDVTKCDSDKPLSDDYLLTNLLHTKREAVGRSSHGEENPISPFKNSKTNKSPMAQKQNYPSLNLYKKSSPVDSDMKYLQVPQSVSTSAQPSLTTEGKDKMLFPKAVPTKTGLSPGALYVIEDYSPTISPHSPEKDGLPSEGKRPPNLPEKTKCLVKDTKAKDFGNQPTPREKESGGQTMSTKDVIRAAREAINAAKSKARSASYSDSISKNVSDTEELRQKEMDDKVLTEMFRGKEEGSVPESKDILSQTGKEATSAALIGKINVNKEPPPVPKRNFTKSDIQLSLDKQQTLNSDRDLSPKEKEHVQKQGKLKHVFSARLNNYIKNQRYSATSDEQVEEYEEGSENVNLRAETDEKSMSHGEIQDSEHIVNDLQALKELERARLGDRMLENKKEKLEAIKIDEEAKAKNDLISRELRNIKKGMLSMRGNTSAKRDIFASKEKEQNKQDTYTKMDSNVVVNKALINDNYDKAKMALEEIISERERRRNKFPEQEANPTPEENITGKSSETCVQQGKKATKHCVTEVREKQNGNTSSFKEKDLKERLGNLKDHKQVRQILSQTEPKPGESHRSGGGIALPGINTFGNELNTLLNDKVKHTRDQLTDKPLYFKEIARQVSEESGEYLKNESQNKKVDTPRVPPRSKKVGCKREEGSNKVKDNEDQIVFTNDGNSENHKKTISETRTGSEIQEIYSDEVLLSESEMNDRKENNYDNLATNEPVLVSNYIQPENTFCLSPKLRANETTSNNLQIITSPTRDITTESSIVKTQEMYKIKPKAPLKPDHLTTTDDYMTKSPTADEELGTVRDAGINVETEPLSEIPRNILSPLLLVNGNSVPQSPPDQASLSSKSSYFSVESALHRNMETESNVFHSLENLTGEVEEIDEVRQIASRKDSDRAEMEYYSLSDHESEVDGLKQPMIYPQKEPESLSKYSAHRDSVTTGQKVTHEESDSAIMSPANALSPTLEIPSLFKVKDNTSSHKLKKVLPSWSPRGRLNGSEKVEEVHNGQENPETPLADEISTSNSFVTLGEIFKPQNILSNQSPLSHSNLQSENLKKPQVGGLLTVPQEDDKFSRVTPSSEGVESFLTSTADTADNTALNAESDGTKALSERSGSTCSGNDSQTGLPRPPAVLPKSEKAVQKAIKLTNRRMKKEEAQKLSHKSSQSSSKHRGDRHKSDKSEQKSSSSVKTGRTGEKKHRGKLEEGHCHKESHHSNDSSAKSELPSSYNESHHHNRAEMSPMTRRQSHDSVERNNQSREVQPGVASERQGRSSDRHVRDKPEQRHYSSDRVISNIPVYKAQVSERPTSDRAIQRSVSIDRYLSGKVERRLSTDVAMNEKLDPRAQRIEKSIMDELQQRGRAKDKASRDNPLRRSHSIDAYSAEVPHPSSLTRQSSHTSQLSRQSSIEHTIVTQTFPMAQRKLLQDPDSGQYYFVDLPVQVKTKTFFDPETRSYVQLPVQPPDGAVPQASPMEVLTPPLVVYHSFVPVPLSPMAKKTTIQKAHVEPDEFEQRHLERARQLHCKEGHPYLEPAYCQHDLLLDEFMGTEELDVSS